MEDIIIDISNFDGGLTLNDKVGNANQFKIGTNVDFDTYKGKITTGVGHISLTHSASYDMPNEFQCINLDTDGELYLGCDNAKIFVQNTWVSIIDTHTDANGSNIRSMVSYENCMYWAGATTIGKKTFTNTWTDSWQSGLATNVYHPMHVAAPGNMYIGHGKYVASYDNTTWTLDALDLPTGWEVKTLTDFGWRYLAIGANFVDSKSKIFLWDKSSASWTDEIEIPENEIKAAIFVNGYLWIWAGETSNIYVCPEGSRRFTKMFNFSNDVVTNLLSVYPNAVAKRSGKIYFALSDDLSAFQYHDKNPTGVYSFPVDPNKFALNIVYRNADEKERFKSLGIIEYSTDELLYIPELSGGVLGDFRLKREASRGNNEGLYSAGADFETFDYEAPPNMDIRTNTFGIECDPLSAESITLYYQKDGDTTWGASIINSFSTAGGTRKIIKKQITTHKLKLKVTYTGGSTNRPYIKRIFVSGHLVPKANG
ncbi:MAG: hypothetical protein ACTSUF_06195 [Candidatus Heimdallarchaeaceae archaeon]